MLLSTRSRGTRWVPKPPYFDPDRLSDPQNGILQHHLKKNPPAAPDGSACGTAPAGRRLPAGSRRRHALQYSTRNISALAGGPIFFKACGAGQGWARKKSFFPADQQKHKKALACGALLMVLSIARVVDRPATCSRARRHATRGDRHEENRSRAREARRRAEYGAISGG